jgi:hypothetical protein
MRKVKEVLHLYYEKNLSTREIGQSLGVGRSTVHDYLDRAQKAGFGWPLPPDLDEASLGLSKIPFIRSTRFIFCPSSSSLLKFSTEKPPYISISPYHWRGLLPFRGN